MDQQSSAIVKILSHIQTVCLWPKLTLHAAEIATDQSFDDRLLDV